MGTSWIKSQNTTISRLDAWWVVEVACLICAFFTLIAIVAILKIHNDQPFTGWTFYFSLNTIISFLGGTINKSAMLLAVSACLAQGKFTWFYKRRGQLSLFKIMDDATRGPMGSVKLLFHLRGL